MVADGTNVYLYGNGRIAQYRAGGVDYFLGDALGSVRQLADANGNVVLAKDYQPYGEELGHTGSGYSSYGFTGEMTDLTGLVYLRARYYAPWQGRFLSRDTWEGNDSTPISYNRWLYGFANPIRFIDPLGLCACDEYKMGEYDHFFPSGSIIDVYDEWQEAPVVMKDVNFFLNAFGEENWLRDIARLEPGGIWRVEKCSKLYDNDEINYNIINFVEPAQYLMGLWQQWLVIPYYQNPVAGHTYRYNGGWWVMWNYPYEEEIFPTPDGNDGVWTYPNLQPMGVLGTGPFFRH